MLLHCDELADLLPAYALEALPPDERALVEVHVATCPACRALLAEYQAVAEGLLYAAPLVAAPPHLEADLRRRLKEARPKAALDRSLSRLQAWLAGLSSLPARPALAVGGLFLLLLVASNLYWISTTNQLRAQQAVLAQQLEAQAMATRMLAAGGRTVVLRGDAPAPGGVGTLILAPDRPEAVLIVDGLPSPPAGKIYQLWLIRNGQRDSGGLFTVDAGGRGVLVVRAPRPLANYQAVGVTAEPVGGSPGPTSPRVIGGGLL